jgi:tetratricopeptide (TPR) repeat protein
MKIKMMLLCCFCICCQAVVQVKGQDIRKMSAAEQEAWKKKVLDEQTRNLKQLAATANIDVDELSLPGGKIEMPPKDLRRLASIPRQTPNMQQLTAQIRLARSRLEKMVKPELREAVTAMTATMSAEQKHTAAAGAFYAGQPEQAVLIAMQTALENPGEVMPWNNLAAIMTMSGLEHQAIPILMHQLETNPESSLLLNNMGQAYLGLGDIGMAELF